jgi:hypothetical protein
MDNGSEIDGYANEYLKKHNLFAYFKRTVYFDIYDTTIWDI